MKFTPWPLLILLFVSLPLVAQDLPPLLTELQPDDPGPYGRDSFGRSLSVSGNTLAVGAYAGALEGLVYIYERHSGGSHSWGQAHRILNPIPGTRLFGRLVALDGDTLVVALGIHNPEVHVLERNAGGVNAWGVTAQLFPSDLQYIDGFGNDIAIEGDVIIIGASHNNNRCCHPPGTLVNSGAAFVYERNLGGLNQWGESQILKASDEKNWQNFGTSLAIDQGTIAVGAHGDDHACPGDFSCDSGAVYVFEHNLHDDNSWSETAKLIPSGIAKDDLFGNSVDISGGTIIAGAVGDDDGCPQHASCNSGAAYVFQLNHGGVGAWGEVTKLTVNPQWRDVFGTAVSIDGNRVLIGASRLDPGPPYAPNGLCNTNSARCGGAYLFERGSAESPFELQGLLSAEPPPAAVNFNFFGATLALQDDLVIVGAHRDNAEIGAPGSVYLFEPEQPPLSTLFTHYPLDDGDGDIASDSGNGNDGSLVASPSWIDSGMHGGALTFDGRGGHVEIADPGSYSALDAEEGISIAAWVRPEALGGTQMLVSKDDTYELELGLAGGDSYSLRLGNVRIGHGNSPVEAGQWQHLVVTWDGSTVRYFKNARPDGSLEFSAPLIPNNNSLGLGARPRNGIQPATYFLTGSLDEVYVFNRALAGEDVVDLFARSVNVDLTAGLLGLWQLDERTGCSAGDALGDHDGTLGANCPEEGPQWTLGQVGDGLFFDNPGDQVTIPASGALSSLSAFTASAWIRSTPTGSYQAVLDQRDAGNDGYDVFIEPGSRLFLRVNDAVLVGSKTVADGQWHHVAAAYDGSQMQLFVDGVLDAQSSASAGFVATTAPLRLGHHFSSNAFTLKGNLDEVYLHDRALSKLEIATLFFLGQSQ